MAQPLSVLQGTLDLLVLRALTWGTMHGYAIMRWIRQSADGELEVVPTVGRFIIISDPQGAVFALYQPENDMAPDSLPVPGGWSWHELATTDREGAFKFYSSLFGWVKTGDMDMGEAGIYQMYGLGEVPMGGIYNKPKEVPISNWLPYAMVASADDSAATATKLGATILYGPMEVPGGDRVAALLDPQGAPFAVHSRKS